MNFSVNAKGERITTDIVVSGYIREEITERHRMSIPLEIKKLCFLFWYINACDKWDKSICHEFVKINAKGTCFRLDDDYEWDPEGVGLCSVYGINTVKSPQIFTWKIRLNTYVYWACIGLIKDDTKVLKENITDNSYGREDPGCFLINHGAMCYQWKRKENYVKRFDQKGDIIQVTLNMKQHTIRYKVNGIDYGIAYDKLYEDSYRLVVSISDNNEEIELL